MKTIAAIVMAGALGFVWMADKQLGLGPEALSVLIAILFASLVAVPLSFILAIAMAQNGGLPVPEDRPRRRIAASAPREVALVEKKSYRLIGQD